MLVPDWLARRERLSPDKTALIDTLSGNRAISYRAWNEDANRTANLLRERAGVGRGDRVAVLAHNSVVYLDLLFACAKLGALFVPLNTRLGLHELGAIVADTSPRVLAYGLEFAEHARALLAGRTSIERLIALEPAADAREGEILLRERERASNALAEVEAITDDHPFILCSTGGSTGRPKSAILTHGNVLWNSINTIVSWGLCADDIAILNAPLFHTGGINVFTLPLVHVGGTSIVCRAFDPSETFALFERATLFFGVPTMFIALQEHPRWQSAPLHRLRLVISGGAPCPLPVFERFFARGVDFKTGYGLTEAGPNTFWLPPADVRRKVGSVGVPLFHVDVKIMDPDGRECGPDEVGELWIRGPHVCKGYWNRAEETRAAIVEGWLRTGDLARRDDEGYHWIAGRKKDMFISGGENVYPAEVESVLAAHESIVEAAVIGVPDPKWGEVGRAIVVLKPDHRANENEGEIIDFCRERLARYKAPKSVIFVDALPRTGANKIDKKLLSEQHGK